LLLDVSYPRLLLFFSFSYFALNVAFAALYFSDHENINGLQSGTDRTKTTLFWDCFFFSIQVIETIGFGELRPLSPFANWLVVAEVMVGTLYKAFLVGFIFAKISRPSRMARQISFAGVGTLSPVRIRHHHVPAALSFRAVYLRALSQLTDTTVRLVLVRMEDPATGEAMDAADPRAELAVHELNFYLNEQTSNRARAVDFSRPLVPLPWTAVHPLTPSSPLGTSIDWDLFRRSLSEIVYIIEGIDESCSDNVMGRHSYVADEIVRDARYSRMCVPDLTRGTYVMDPERVSAVEPLEEPLHLTPAGPGGSLNADANATDEVEDEDFDELRDDLRHMGIVDAAE